MLKNVLRADDQVHFGPAPDGVRFSDFVVTHCEGLMVTPLTVMTRNGDQPRIERRSVERRFLHLWAVSWRNGSTVRDHVIVTDISTAGFRMRGSASYPVDDAVFLEFAYGLLAEARVVWRNDHNGQCGCSFVEPLADSLFERIVARSDTHELTSVAMRGAAKAPPAAYWADVAPEG